MSSGSKRAASETPWSCRRGSCGVTVSGPPTRYEVVVCFAAERHCLLWDAGQRSLQEPPLLKTMFLHGQRREEAERSATHEASAPLGIFPTCMCPPPHASLCSTCRITITQPVPAKAPLKKDTLSSRDRSERGFPPERGATRES